LVQFGIVIEATLVLVVVTEATLVVTFGAWINTSKWPDKVNEIIKLRAKGIDTDLQRAKGFTFPHNGDNLFGGIRRNFITR
jgi:hypothetical protein